MTHLSYYLKAEDIEKSVIIIRRKKVPFDFKSVVEKERNRGV